MFKSISIGKKALFLIVLILVLDQSFKIWIKTHMMLGQEYAILGNWFIIHFIENNGMAFGFEFGGSIGKVMLGLLRIAAIIGIGWYLYHLIQYKAKTGLILCVSLIIAGAIGNLLDCLFYGIFFNDSYGRVATLFPADGGYSSFLHGKVVDMLYFPLINTHYPHWVPFIGSHDLLFFRHIFNLSDSSIFLGVVLILLFQKKLLLRNMSAETQGLQK
jgi:signal peptidase II